MKAENPVVYKFEMWGCMWDDTPNDKQGERYEVYRTPPSPIKLRRACAEEIGCVGLRRGVDYYYDGTNHRMYSERHQQIVFCSLAFENTGKTYKELKKQYE